MRQIIKMISGHQEETNGTLETIIRAIVLARGRDGATLQDIKRIFVQCDPFAEQMIY